MSDLQPVSSRPVIRRLPAEWEPQAAMLLTWPHPSHAGWRLQWPHIESTYQAIVRALAPSQPVWIVTYDAAHSRHVHHQLAPHVPMSQVQLFPVPTDDTWIRDYGPIGVWAQGTLRLLNSVFTGWGHKHPHARDQAFNARWHQLLSDPSPPLEPLNCALEGGSIDTDGQGTVLTTPSCLLQRQPTWSTAQWATQLRQALGAQRVLWLDPGHLPGDDTDGHVDMVARFVNARTIAYTAPRNAQDTSFITMREQLESFRDAQGRPYHLVPLPQPDGRTPYPATYANCLMGNQVVLVPSYGVASDALACSQLARCFPHHTLVPIDSRALITQGGSIHCATMQLAM